MMTVTSNAFHAYLANLTATLISHYTPPNTGVGYDYNHIYEMLMWGPKIKALEPYRHLDLNEFVIAVWLHNTDRPALLKKEIGFVADRRMSAGEFATVWAAYLHKLLVDSPFDEATRDRIVDAVIQHPKKFDEPGDSVLLTTLRIADKIVRFGPLGMIGQPANNRGHMFYDPKKPFGFGSTRESDLQTVYDDFMRVLEWYGILPSDEARSLVPISWIKAVLAFLRVMGEQIAMYTGKENLIELDLKKALGAYYEKFA
ncbi:MAG: hypothetical protein HY007_02755 [Candidatus Sungbacteria bacterium]|nr:hypothetical protein [Candidatus Sungbacteria bacterium]